MNMEELASLMQTLSPAARADALNQILVGLDALIGVRFISAGPEEVIAELTTSQQHVQPYGLIHGGIYASLGESVCSVGAALSVLSEGRHAVGAENTTRFLRAVRPGATLTATARPIPEACSGEQHRWTAEMVDQRGRRCATSDVAVVILAKDRQIAGKNVSLLEQLRQLSQNPEELITIE